MPFPVKLEFYCPVKVLCGAKALEHLPFELGIRNARRPLLLGDEAAFRENRTQALADALRESEIVLGVVESLPVAGGLDLVHELAAIYRDRDHDALLVMGAGPLTDTAKLVNLVVSTGQDDPTVFAGKGNIGHRLKPMALIAPAAATAYETAGWVKTDRIDLRSAHLMPDLAIIDERTVGAPSKIDVIASSLSALAVGIEALLDPDRNPMKAIYATNAVQMAMRALGSTGATPEAVDWRINAASAAVMAGCTLAGEPPGKLHRLGLHLAATHRLALPQAMGILMPATLAYGARNWDWQPAGLLDALIGMDRSAGTPASQRGTRATAILTSITSDLFSLTAGQIPRTLRDAGFDAEELTSIAEAINGRNEGIGHSAALAILQSALDGEPFHAGLPPAPK